MSTARYIIGDTRAVTASLPDGSVDLVLTSPPFLALRSYLPADHPDKAKEIGSEPGPAEFIDTLLDLAVEWRRVLAPHGSIAIELGDTYAGDDRRKSETIDIKTPHRANGRAASNRPKVGGGWPLDKSLCGIPHLFHLSLAYGRNLLNPDHTIEPWRVRNVIAWCRPNPPVGALGDKFRPATSYMTIATMARDRYFDLDAVRTPSTDTRPRNTNGPKALAADASERLGGYDTRTTNPAGAPPLDYWEISTEPYSGSHYATWPRKLLDRPILAMCPQRVCTVCGKPSERIVEADPAIRLANRERTGFASRDGRESGSYAGGFTTATTTTLGWTDCGHDSWRRGIVLDPFAGSGTTLAVASAHGRDSIGIDLDERNADLALERCGMFLSVENHQPRTAA